MRAVDAANVIVGLSAEGVVDVGVISLFLVAPILCGHLFQRNSFKLFVHLLVLRLYLYPVQILVHAVE